MILRFTYHMDEGILQPKGLFKNRLIGGAKTVEMS